MIQIARVDYPNTPKEFDYLTVNRTGGIVGAHEQVHIEPVDADEAAHQGDGRRLGATIHAFVQEPRTVLLDAALAEHILEIIQPLASLTPLPAAPPPGADMYQWTVELSWGGTITHFEVHGVSSDAALHGVLEVAARLLTGAA